MGCDIHAFVEVWGGGRWSVVDGVEPFDIRNYGIFGFLADVRNYSHSPVIDEPRGAPGDCSQQVREQVQRWDMDGHGFSFLTVAELLAYDYGQVFWDRRITRGSDGGALAEEGEGEHLSLREFLGEWYFSELARLDQLGPPEATRVIFWFDN